MSRQKNKLKETNQIRAYLAMTWYSLIAQTRNPATFAFGFIFPVVFITIFGLIGNSTQTLTIGIPDSTEPNQILTVIEEQSYMKLKTDKKSVLEQELVQGKLSGIIEMQPHDVTITTSVANPQQAQAIESIMRGLIDETNLRIAGIEKPYLTLFKKELSGRQFRYIDFALPGQIGFALLSTAIFGTVFGIVYLKKTLVLKRLFATPARPLSLLLGQGTSRLIIALTQTVIILGIGIYAFGFYLPHGFQTFWNIMIITTIGLIAFLGFGYFFAGLANDENSAGPLVNLITLPQLLLSGTFFPVENLPSWLQPIANNLPLSYFNQAIRIITAEGGSLGDTDKFIAGLSIWGILMYALAARTFRWE